MVVTVGYRLGVFGFAGHPVLSAEERGSSGEYGLFDQMAALHWVQNNIGAFGGDPDNVTLFGESAGSFDAVAIAASPLGEGLFSRLAAQTETFFAARGTDQITDAEDIGLDVAQKVGCSEEPDVAACLRGKPADELVLAAGPQNVQPWAGGAVLPASPLELIAAQAAPPPMPGPTTSSALRRRRCRLGWLPTGRTSPKPAIPTVQVFRLGRCTHPPPNASPSLTSRPPR